MEIYMFEQTHAQVDPVVANVSEEDLFPLVDRWRENWDAKWQRSSNDAYRPEPGFLPEPKSHSASESEPDDAPRSLRVEIKEALEETIPPPTQPDLRQYMLELLRLVRNVTDHDGGVGQLRVRWASIPKEMRTAILELDTARFVQERLRAADQNPSWSTGPT